MKEGASLVGLSVFHDCASLCVCRELFYAKVREAFTHPQFQTDVVRPLDLEQVMDQPVQVLSGGELQRVALIVALGKPAQIYLIDEPSAYLDAEQRIAASKVIKR